MKRMKNSIKALIIAICVVVVGIGAVVGIILVNKNKGGGGPDDSKPTLNKTELKNLADEIEKLGTEVHYFPTFDEIENFLLENCNDNDLLITMGAGDVYKIGEKLLGK